MYVVVLSPTDSRIMDEVELEEFATDHFCNNPGSSLNVYSLGDQFSITAGELVWTPVV